jgi:hypothetical protein
MSREGAEEATRIDKCPLYDRVPESSVVLDLLTTFQKLHSNFVAKLYLTSVSQRRSIFDLADSAVFANVPHSESTYTEDFPDINVGVGILCAAI